MVANPLVCVVDDQTDYCLLLQLLFRRFLPAYATRFFSSSTDLLDTLAELDPLPRLIILDRHMPVVDGYQTLVRLKENTAFRKIPVVMMSHDASSRQIECCYEAGVNSFLLKGIDFNSTRKTIIDVCTYWIDINKIPGSVRA